MVSAGSTSPIRRRARRTQEERKALTRARLIDAVIKVIERKGYAGLRAKHIAATSGMTWGAAQHLFGGRNELLLQVATRASDELAKRLDAGLVSGSASLHERVAAVVDMIWTLYSSPDYFAMVEIVRGTRGDAHFHSKLVEALGRLSTRIETLWLTLFADVRISKGRSLSLCNIVVLTLSGLAARKIYLRLTPNTAQMLEELVACITTGLSTDMLPGRPAKRGQTRRTSKGRL